MRSKRRILLFALPLGLLLVALIGAVAWEFMHPPPPEPIIQGQPLSYWANLLQNPSQNTSATSLAVATGAAPAGQTLVSGSAVWTSILNTGAPPTNFTAQSVPLKTTVGPGDVPILLQAIEMQDNPIRRAYRNLYPKLPTWVQSRWAPTVDPAPVRTNAALVLTLGNDTQYNINLMKTYPNPFLRRFAAVAVAFNANVRDTSATEALAVALNDKDPGVRAKAAMGLGLYRRDKSKVVAPLLKSLRDRDAKVRFYSAVALSETAEGRAVALPEIIKGLKSSDVFVRNAASSTLAQNYPEESEKHSVK